jgi:hypothetical protein
MTPYEALTGTKFFIGHLRSFGKTMFIHIPVEARSAGTKMEASEIMEQFCSYRDSDKIYCVYIRSQRNLVLSRYLRFKGLYVGKEIETMKTDTPPKSKQIEIKQESSSRPPTPPVKLSDSNIEHMFNQQMLRETMRHITNNEFEEEEEEEEASIVGASFSRPTPEHTSYNNVNTNTDQRRRNSVREQKSPARYRYNI